MKNRDLQAAWHYHNGTNHPNGFLMDPWHRFDSRSQPMLLKKYVDGETVSLPTVKDSIGISALGAISENFSDKGGSGGLDIDILAKILHYSAGITKHIRYPWGVMSFRAAACTGALYHIELYLVCGDLPGLKAGVYHFDPDANSLDVLRKGDYRPTLVKASGEDEAIAQAPAVIVYSDVFWRNACKYQARAYRHAFWDSGTILSHSLALAAAYDLPTKLVLGFIDREVNKLLGLADRREVALALLPIGTGDEILQSAPLKVEELNLQTAPISKREIDFEPIHIMHEASSLADPVEVTDWRNSAFKLHTEPPPEKLISLDPYSEAELPSDALEEVIVRRGSSRRFSQESISFKQLSTILSKSTKGLPVDYSPTSGRDLNQLYLIVLSVDGLTPGAYVFHREQGALELLEKGDFRGMAGHLSLGQALAADASVNIYFLAGLPKILAALGNRGYRAAQLEASITAGKMYLAAYDLGLGATGLTFYDDEVVNFFSPHSQEKSVMFLIALGIPLKRKT
jgi:SagB-type dehydrogenase family enzyme